MKGCTHNIHACADATLERRQTKNAAGVVLHCLQCMNCGRHTCHKVKRDGTEPPELDLELARRGEEALRELYAAAADEQKRATDAAKEQWRAEYQEYLRTPQWAALRERVKLRDKVCQGCLAAPVEEVHHLTYDHVKEEFAFELVGLCRKCHARLHGVAA